MAHPQDIEDVLSSIRRLVATEGPPLKPRHRDPVTGERDTTLPALFLDPAHRVTDPEDPFQMIRSLAQEERDGRDAETFMEDMDPDIAAITYDMPGGAFDEWDGDDDPEMSLAPEFRGPIEKAAPDEDRGSVADRIIAQLRAAQGRSPQPQGVRSFEGTEPSVAGLAHDDERNGAGAEVVPLTAGANWPTAPVSDGEEDDQAPIDEDVVAPMDQPEIAALAANYAALTAEDGETPNILTDDAPEEAILFDGPKPSDVHDDVKAASSDIDETVDDVASEDMSPEETLADGVAANTVASLPAELGQSIMVDEGLRDLIAQVVREELAGELGERITRNVRKLVRRELRNMMAAGEFD